jgi:HEAT repeat protein
MTIDQLRAKLSDIEPDNNTYAGIGSDDIPLLQQMTQTEEPWLAARAVFAISRIADNRTLPALEAAAASPRPEVRVAVAAASRTLSTAATDRLLPNLLDDVDPGVRKFAVEAVSPANAVAVRDRLRRLETQDPAPFLRKAARERIRALGPGGSPTP